MFQVMLRALFLVLLLSEVSKAAERCPENFRWYGKIFKWVKDRILPEGTLSLSQSKYEQALTLYRGKVEDSQWFHSHPPKSPEEKLAYGEVVVQQAGAGKLVARSISEIGLKGRASLARALRTADFEGGVSRSRFEQAYKAAWDVLNPRTPVEGSGGWITRFRLRTMMWDARQREQQRVAWTLDDAIIAHGFDRIPGFSEALSAFKKRHPRIVGFTSFALFSAVIFAAEYLLDRKSQAQNSSKMIEALENSAESMSSDMFINDLFEGLDPADPLVHKLREADRKFMESQKRRP